MKHTIYNKIHSIVEVMFVMLSDLYVYIYIYFKILLMSILNISLIGNTDTYIIGINNYK